MEDSFKYIAPNYLVKFCEHARKIEIGPVTAILSADLNRNFQSGAEFDISFDENGISVQLPQTCWYVSVNATKGNVREEAAWLINVALSFLRLSYPDRKDDFFPLFGEVETMPLIKPESDEQGIIISDKDMMWTNSSVPRLYIVDSTIVAITEEREFKDRAQEIFFPSKNSLAERFSQGLGWLTRGRQTADRSERFLFFFTAIESLLSGNDKTAPVVQTISRYAATILDTDAGKRAEIAKKIRSLYSIRSLLVHTGKRNVSQSESIVAQKIAEILYKKVMESVPLNTRFDKFQESLSKASYGLPWP